MFRNIFRQMDNKDTSSHNIHILHVANITFKIKMVSKNNIYNLNQISQCAVKKVDQIVSRCFVCDLYDTSQVITCTSGNKF